MDVPRVVHRFADVQGVRVFYRSAGPEDAPRCCCCTGSRRPRTNSGGSSTPSVTTTG